MEDTILSILKGIHPDYDFSAANDFIDEGLLDSYDMMMLVMELEKSFGLMIDPLDIVPENFMNLETLCAMIKRSKTK